MMYYEFTLKSWLCKYSVVDVTLEAILQVSKVLKGLTIRFIIVHCFVK